MTSMAGRSGAATGMTASPRHFAWLEGFREQLIASGHRWTVQNRKPRGGRVDRMANALQTSSRG